MLAVRLAMVMDMGRRDGADDVDVHDRDGNESVTAKAHTWYGSRTRRTQLIYSLYGCISARFHYQCACFLLK